MAKPILHDIQSAFEEMRRMYLKAPRWFVGPSAIVADRLVRLVLARHEIDTEIADLLTRERLFQAAQIVVMHTRGYQR